MRKLQLIVRIRSLAGNCASGLRAFLRARVRLRGHSQSAWNAFERARRFAADDPVKIATGRSIDVLSRASRNAKSARRSPPATSISRKAFSIWRPSAASHVDPALADKVKKAQTDAASATHTAGRFVQGLWTGEPTDLASLAGTAVGDLVRLRRHPRCRARGNALSARPAGRSRGSLVLPASASPSPPAPTPRSGSARRSGSV